MIAPDRAVEAHLAVEDHVARPALQLSVFDPELRRVLATWGAPGAWSAGVYDVSVDGTVWPRGISTGRRSLDLAIRAAFRDLGPSISRLDRGAGGGGGRLLTEDPILLDHR